MRLALSALAIFLATHTITVAVRAQTAPSPPSEPAANPHANFAGTFRFAGGAAEQNALYAAIDQTIAGMGFIAEPIARGRLRERNPIPPTVTIAFPPAMIEVNFAGRPNVRTADNGALADARNAAGEPIRVSQRFQANTLVREMQAPQGRRREELTLSTDGQTLTVRSTVSSDRLPRPLTYTLTYRR